MKKEARQINLHDAGTLNEKSDVYAYGVVLLEMLTAAEVVDTKRPAAHHNVVDWLYSKLHDINMIREARSFTPCPPSRRRPV